MIRVAFQGELGAYSEEALQKHFTQRTEPVPCHSFTELFNAVTQGTADFGVQPIENSTAGAINAAYDLLLERDVNLSGEIVLRVRHALLAAPGSTKADVRRVRSHPQALAQCSHYLAAHDWQPESAYDTAGSAKALAAAPENDVAVIASRLAGERYGLDVLGYPIEDQAHNYTRFLVLSHRPPPHRPDAQHKTSLVFSTPHVPGAIHTCLGAFAARQINLTKFESRPQPDRPWHYIFYLDFEGHVDAPHCRAALTELQEKASFVKVLGSYPAAATDEHASG